MQGLFRNFRAYTLVQHKFRQLRSRRRAQGINQCVQPRRKRAA